MLNGIICAAVLLISLILVLRPSLTNMSGSGEGDPVAALSAARTYICFIALDAAVIMSLMLYGAFTSQSVGEYILIAAPSVFMLGVVKYFIDIRKIGVSAEGTDDATEIGG